ncbi:hypothetical protein ACGFX8_36905 [Streptomyces sp. NPDC048362]|uniref:hypothetical protein n=1 Tax=Streptomyces sp. NPDC048362 TaxID=3365539 RepID=UPI00371064CD
MTGAAPSVTISYSTAPQPPNPPQLAISKSHSGTFQQGSTGDYTLTVANTTGAGPTTGAVTVTDSLPAGVTFISATGTGWTCSQASGTVTCTRSDTLSAGQSYPPITLTVNVTANAACTFTNSATVSGGGGNPATTTDSTTVTGGTCNGSNGGNGGNNGGNGGNGGGGSLLPINLSGLLPMFNNISTNNNINSPGATNTTNQVLHLNGS